MTSPSASSKKPAAPATPLISAATLADAVDIALILVDRGGRPILVNRQTRARCRSAERQSRVVED